MHTATYSMQLTCQLRTGFDRLVAVLCGGIPLTDTIAFPKSARGHDMMCKAPSSLTEDVLDMYHITIRDRSG